MHCNPSSKRLHLSPKKHLDTESTGSSSELPKLFFLKYRHTQEQSLNPFLCHRWQEQLWTSILDSGKGPGPTAITWWWYLPVQAALHIAQPKYFQAWFFYHCIPEYFVAQFYLLILFTLSRRCWDDLGLVSSGLWFHPCYWESTGSSTAVLPQACREKKEKENIVFLQTGQHSTSSHVNFFIICG